jgi:hypothetical protein
MPDFGGDSHATLAGEPDPGLADRGPGALVGFDEVFTEWRSFPASYAQARRRRADVVRLIQFYEKQAKK